MSHLVQACAAAAAGALVKGTGAHVGKAIAGVVGPAVVDAAKSVGNALGVRTPSDKDTDSTPSKKRSREETEDTGSTPRSPKDAAATDGDDTDNTPCNTPRAFAEVEDRVDRVDISPDDAERGSKKKRQKTELHKGELLLKTKVLGMKTNYVEQVGSLERHERQHLQLKLSTPKAKAGSKTNKLLRVTGVELLEDEEGHQDNRFRVDTSNGECFLSCNEAESAGKWVEVIESALAKKKDEDDDGDEC
jgi:hypothetical protein